MNRLLSRAAVAALALSAVAVAHARPGAKTPPVNIPTNKTSTSAPPLSVTPGSGQNTTYQAPPGTVPGAVVVTCKRSQVSPC